MPAKPKLPPGDWPPAMVRAFNRLTPEEARSLVRPPSPALTRAERAVVRAAMRHHRRWLNAEEDYDSEAAIHDACDRLIERQKARRAGR